MLNIIVRLGLSGAHSQQTPKMFEPNGLVRTCVDFLFIIGGCVSGIDNNTNGFDRDLSHNNNRREGIQEEGEN